MKVVDAGQLKQVVKEVLGTAASHTLMTNVCDLLDTENKDPASLKKACAKIEKMVRLFIGPDQARTLNKRFGDVLS